MPQSLPGWAGCSSLHRRRPSMGTGRGWPIPLPAATASWPAPGARRAAPVPPQTPGIAKEIARLLRVLQAHLAAVGGRIAARIAACPALAEDQRRLTTVPGTGPALCPALCPDLCPDLHAVLCPDLRAVLIARLPEPGQLDHRRIASLAGLAPLISKLKALPRKAAACTCDDLRKAVGTVRNLFTNEECCNDFKAAGYETG